MQPLKSGVRSRWWWLGLALLASCSANSAEASSTTMVVTVSSPIRVVDWLPSDAGGPPRGSDITRLERVELGVACLRLYGIDAHGPEEFDDLGVEYFGGPAIFGTVGDEAQSDFVNGVSDACSGVIEEWYPRKVFSPEERYRFKIEIAACLRELGYPVEDAPTMEVWIDSISDQGVSPWDPFDLVIDAVPLEEAEAARAYCEGE